MRGFLREKKTGSPPHAVIHPGQRCPLEDTLQRCHTSFTCWTSYRCRSLAMRFLVVAAIALLGVTATAQRADVGGSASISKLTTVLADLVQSVPQETGQVTTQRAGSTTSLSVDTLPRSVQDAVRSRRLRFGTNNDVQVYILLNAVTDDTVRQLTEAGATIEIRDAARRRVQAHLPVARLQSIAQLETVDAIRLPTYARRRVGQVTTEGDGILYGDAVRQQFGLDGTGVRVGVVSD